MADRNFIQAQKFELAGGGIGKTDTSITLKSFNDSAGNPISAGELNSVNFGTLEPGTSREEIISFTNSITINSDGTVTLNVVTRGLQFTTPYTADTSLRKSHAGSSIFILTNNPQIYKAILDYLDGIAIAGAPDASTSIKGIVEIADETEINNDDDTGTTTAPVVVTPSKLALSKYGLRLPTVNEKAAMVGAGGTPGATNKFLTQDAYTSSGNDQTQTTQNASIEIGEADTTLRKRFVHQSFVPSKAKIRGVKLWKSANTGTFTGNVTVSIQADVAGNPSGAALATMTFTNAQWNSTALGEITALFNVEYLTLTVGGTYWISISTSSADNTNHPNIGTNSAGGYAAGVLKYYNITDGYVSVTADLYFKTLEGNVSQIIQTDTTGKIPTDLLPYAQYPYYQKIYAPQSVSAGMTSSTDGKTLIFTDVLNSTIARYDRDAKTGYFTRTYVTTFGNAPSAGLNGVVILGAYVYAFFDEGTNAACWRFDYATGANKTIMSMPGIAVSGSAQAVQAWTDGTFLYFNAPTNNSTVYKLSISGTTLSTAATSTGVADIISTYTSHMASFFDGSNTYLVKGDTTTTGMFVVIKLVNADGTSVVTTNTNITFNYSSSSQGGGVAFGNDMMYIVKVNSIASQTFLDLIPISKP